MVVDSLVSDTFHPRMAAEQSFIASQSILSPKQCVKLSITCHLTGTKYQCRTLITNNG